MDLKKAKLIEGISMIRCTCCQTELKAPQFYNGNPYGYTCIKKVDPSFKKSKIIYLECEEFKVVQSGQRNVVNVKVSGKLKQVVVYGDIQTRTTGTFIQDGKMYIGDQWVK